MAAFLGEIDGRLLAVGVVGLGAINRLADDDVIDQADLEEFGRFDEVLGDLGVRFARERAAGGVIVSDDEAVGVVIDDGLKNVADVGDGLIGRATGDFNHAFELMLAVEGKHVESFGFLVRHDGCKILVDFGRFVELFLVNRLADSARSELEGGEELAGFRKAKAVFFAEFLDVERSEGGEVTVFSDELLANLDGTCAFRASA